MAKSVAKPGIVEKLTVFVINFIVRLAMTIGLVAAAYGLVRVSWYWATKLAEGLPHIDPNLGWIEWAVGLLLAFGVPLTFLFLAGLCLYGIKAVWSPTPEKK